MNGYTYLNIGGFCFATNADASIVGKMENFKPFILKSFDGEPLFTLNLGREARLSGKLVHSSDEYLFNVYGDGHDFAVDFKCRQSGDTFVMRFDDTFSEFSSDMRVDDINADIFSNMLMLALTFAMASHQSLMMHASVAVVDNKAYLFLGKSGTGKSTHCKLWLKNIEGADILNDDNPILRFQDGGVYAYGSAWSGKGCVYKNEKYPVGGIVRLQQAPLNRIERRTGAQAFALVYSSCSKLPWSESMMSDIMQTFSQIIKAVPVFFMECLPDDNAALMAYKTMNLEK